MPRATSAPLMLRRRRVFAERSSAAGGVWCLLACGGREEAAQIGARGGAFARLLRRPPGHGRNECLSRASRLPGCYWLPGRRLFSGTECSLAPSKLAARAPPPSSPLVLRPRPRIPGGPSDAVGRSAPQRLSTQSRERRSVKLLYKEHMRGRPALTTKHTDSRGRWGQPTPPTRPW